MSEDNTTTTISEETITSIVNATENIANDSDAIRQTAKAIAKALHPVIQRAGIEFGSLDDSQMWSAGEYPDQWTMRIGTMKVYDGWMIGIEETQLFPEYWDGSNWLGHADPFNKGAYANGAATIKPFSQASRNDLIEMVQRLPAFIEEYAAELKRRHIKYSDVREKAEQIRKVMESD